MKMRKLFAHVVAIAAIVCLSIVSLRSEPVGCKTMPSVVQMSSMYTYTQMESDIATLATRYPNVISYASLGKTALGRDITVVCLGNKSAAHSVMVQSSIHAREYLCTQVTMKMIEYYGIEKSKDTLGITTFGTGKR